MRKNLLVALVLCVSLVQPVFAAEYEKYENCSVTETTVSGNSKIKIVCVTPDGMLSYSTDTYAMKAETWDKSTSGSFYIKDGKTVYMSPDTRIYGVPQK